MIGLWSCPSCGAVYTSVKDYLDRPTRPALCQSCGIALLTLATVPEKGDLNR